VSREVQPRPGCCQAGKSQSSAAGLVWIADEIVRFRIPRETIHAGGDDCPAVNERRNVSISNLISHSRRSGDRISR